MVMGMDLWLKHQNQLDHPLSTSARILVAYTGGASSSTATVAGAVPTVVPGTEQRYAAV